MNCEKCSINIDSVESLLNEACELEARLKEIKFRLSCSETQIDIEQEMLKDIIQALKIFGMYKRIDYYLIRNGMRSIIAWDKRYDR